MNFLYLKLNNKHSNFNKESSNSSLEDSKNSDEHSKGNLRSKQKKKKKEKMVLVRIATIKSRVKGHHVNNYKYTIGEELGCKLEVQNRYSTHTIMALANEKNEKSKGKTSKKLNKARSSEWITVGHIPDDLVVILFPLMKTWKIYSTKAKISENHRAQPEKEMSTWQTQVKYHVIMKYLEHKSIKNLLERQ